MGGERGNTQWCLFKCMYHLFKKKLPNKLITVVASVQGNWKPRAKSRKRDHFVVVLLYPWFHFP